jgi:hypothetical protein
VFSDGRITITGPDFRATCILAGGAVVRVEPALRRLGLIGLRVGQVLDLCGRMGFRVRGGGEGVYT